MLTGVLACLQSALAAVTGRQLSFTSTISQEDKAKELGYYLFVIGSVFVVAQIIRKLFWPHIKVCTSNLFSVTGLRLVVAWSVVFVWLIFGGIVLSTLEYAAEGERTASYCASKFAVMRNLTAEDRGIVTSIEDTLDQHRICRPPPCILPDGDVLAQGAALIFLRQQSAAASQPVRTHRIWHPEPRAQTWHHANTQ